MDDEPIVVDPAEARYAVRRAFTALDASLRLGNRRLGEMTLDHVVDELVLATSPCDLSLHVGPNVVTLDGTVVHAAAHVDGNVAGRLFGAGVRQIHLPIGAAPDGLRALVQLVMATDGHALGRALLQAPVGRFERVDTWSEHHRRRAKSFMGPYRAVLTELFPGVAGPPPPEHRHRDTLMMTEAVRRAEDAFSAANADADVAGPRLVAEARVGWTGGKTGRHLVDMLVRLILRDGQPLSVSQGADALLGALLLLGADNDWRGIADGLRGLADLGDAALGGDSKAVAGQTFIEASLGARAVRAVARVAEVAPPDFMMWARHQFHHAGRLTADSLVGAFDGVTSPAGLGFLRDLISWRDDLTTAWWLERVQDGAPHVVTEALVALQRVELSARQRETLASTLSHPNADTRLRGLRLLGRSITPEIRAAFLGLLTDESYQVRQAVLARLVHLGDAHSASAIVAVVRSEQFNEFDEEEQRHLFEALARLGGDRYIRAFRDILKLDEGGTRLGRLFRREQIPDDPVRRAALYGLAALGTPDAIQSLELVAKRGQRLLADLASQLCGAATSGQLRHDALLSVAPSRIDAPLETPALDDAAQGLMGDGRLFEPTDYGLAPSESLEMLLQGYLSDGAAGPVSVAPPAPPPSPPVAPSLLTPATATDAPTADDLLVAAADGAADPAATAVPGAGLLAPEATPRGDSESAFGAWGDDFPDAPSLPETDGPDLELESSVDGDGVMPDFARTTLSLEPVRPGAGFDFGALAALGAEAGSAGDVFPAEGEGEAQPASLGSLSPPEDTEAPSGLAPPLGFGAPGAEVAPELALLLADLGEAPSDDLDFAASQGPLGGMDLSVGPDALGPSESGAELPPLVTSAPGGGGWLTDAPTTPVPDGGGPAWLHPPVAAPEATPSTGPQPPVGGTPPPVGQPPRRGPEVQGARVTGELPDPSWGRTTGSLPELPPTPRPGTGPLLGGERGQTPVAEGLMGLKGDDTPIDEDDAEKGPTNAGLGSLLSNLFGDDA